jgi:hypothetical protein
MDSTLITLSANMADRTWRSAILTTALVSLFKSSPEVAMALWRSRIVGMDRLPDDRLTIKLRLHGGEHDRWLLASETRSWTGSDMPGLLDLAFENALPGHDWPVFAFEIADDKPAA